jgi:hypothetical protein
VTDSDICQILRRCGRQAGIAGRHPHLSITPVPIPGALRAATRPMSWASPAGAPDD